MAKNMRDGGHKERERNSATITTRRVSKTPLLGREGRRDGRGRMDDGGMYTEDRGGECGSDNHFGSRHCVSLYTSTLRFGDVIQPSKREHRGIH